MAINFPSTTSQATDGSFTHTDSTAGITWTWDGTSWSAGGVGGGGGGSGGSISGIDTTGTSFFNQINASGISTFASSVFVGVGSSVSIGGTTLGPVDSGIGQMGSIQLNGDGAYQGYAGYNINGKAAFFHNDFSGSGTDYHGLFDTVNQKFSLMYLNDGVGGSGTGTLIYGGGDDAPIHVRSDYAQLNYINGTTTEKKLITTGIGVSVTGDLVVNGNANVSGVSTIGNIEINNNKIENTNAGGALILAAKDNLQLRVNSASSNLALVGNNGGSVDLYHNNVKKFETTSYGAEVVGGIGGFDYLQAPHGATVNFDVDVAAKTSAHRYDGSGSANGYTINGVEAPFLTLTPGRTYRFNLDSFTMGNHPFRFYLEADKTTEYTTNVTTMPSYTEIVVTDTTPTILHYQCSAHGYMGNAIQTNSAGSTAPGGTSVSDETSSTSTFYPIFGDVTSGSATTKVSSTKLTFTPSTGNLEATQFTSLSDRSKKTNIRPIQNALDITKQLDGVRFDWKDSDKESLGVIAQDVEKVLPELVETSDDGTKSVAYQNMVAVLIEAVKEQQKQIDRQQELINQLMEG